MMLCAVRTHVKSVPIERCLCSQHSVCVLPKQVAEGLNDTAESFLAAIANNESEVAPSSIYAAAAVLEGVPFINGSPQNTFVPGLIELAVQRGASLGFPTARI